MTKLNIWRPPRTSCLNSSRETHHRAVLQNADAVFMHRQPNVFALRRRGRDGLQEGETNQCRCSENHHDNMLRADQTQGRVLTSASNSLAPKKGHFLATVR